MSLKNFIIILCFVLPNIVVSQFSNLKFENFDTKEGLSSSTCLEVFEDKDGFLWFGTIDGLNKYNGYEFEVYRFILDDLNSISNNRINVIQEDNEGNLWIGTNNGLNFLNKSTNKFSRIDLYKQLSLSNSHKKIINDLLYDKINNHLWVATNNGIIKIVLQDDNKNVENFKFSYYLNDESNLNSIDNNSVNDILMDKNDQSIWVGTNGNHLNHYNAIEDNFERVLINSKKPYELNHIKKRVFIDSDGDFWIGNDLSNLILWNKKLNTFRNISFVENSIPILDIYQDKNGLFWVSTDVNGLYLFKKEENKILHHIENNFSDPFSLPNNKPSKIFEDSNGIFWFGTYDKGVAKLDFSEYIFDHYYYKPNTPDGLSAKVSQSVLEDSKGRIWISSYNEGLDFFDEKSKSFNNYANASNSLSSNKILYTFESKDGHIWICTLDGGVNKFNPDENTFETFLHDVNDSLSIGQSSVWAGIEDSKNRLWFALRTEGLSLYSPKTNRFKSYKNVYGNKNNLVSNSVLSLFVDSKDRLFVGTSLGLNVVDLNSIDKFIPNDITFREIKEKGIKDYGVNYITEDHQGNIWLGTDNGIFKLDSNLNLIKSYSSSQNGLPNNLVVGIKEDENHDFWITTKGGLSLLDPETHKFKNFNTNDGLQGVEFQSKSIEKTKDGRIIIGGNNGFNIFDPNDINKIHESVKLKPRINKFKLNNRVVSVGDSINGRVVLNKSIAEVQNLKLAYNENYISFEFLALHLENPDQVRYAYRMVGLDNEYINIGSNRDVNLPNLEPGDYKFEVKASIDGKWENAPAAKVEFKILPPLWKTWWAYILYFIIGSSLFWIVTRYYTSKVQEAQQHELDQMKLQFFVNVSHEFRTPLTLILNPVDKILSSFNNDPETIKSSALSIQRSARRLLHLVNQLLDYRKMDVGMSPLRLEKGDIVKFSEDIFSLFKDLAVKKEINYVFEAKQKTINSVFDFDKIEKIITNLISNAIKFTNSGGDIIVSINKRKAVRDKSNYTLKKEKLGDYIEIAIKDTGVGLNKEQLRSVFSRFYNVDTTKSGTGIGLNFTKGLVELHGGEILVESDYMKGSKFIVKIPLNIKANSEKVENFKDEFLINSMKAVEYDMLISNDEQLTANSTVEESVNEKSKLPTILIVEDNKELRMHIINDLKGVYEIKEAVNGEEGLKMVKKHYPDIVISDVMMPKMDGFEMCKLIKTEFDTSHIPVLLLTARTLEEDRIEGYKNGADGYLSKPFVISVLKARIENLLQTKDRLRKRFSEVGGVFPSSEVASNNLDEAFLDKATKVIIDNIGNVDFKQDDLLKEMSMGRSQFYRKINSLTGHNPSYFIRTIRLKYASELLIKSEHSIKEITHMCGFNSTAYFSKTFKELFNVTPTEFTEQEKKSSN